jgi:hypothetical protein
MGSFSFRGVGVRMENPGIQLVGNLQSRSEFSALAYNCLKPYTKSPESIKSNDSNGDRGTGATY